MSFATPPPVLQPPPKKADPLLRNVLIGAGVLVTLILVGGIYVGYQMMKTLATGINEGLGRKQPVERKFSDGWVVAKLPDVGWTLELPAVARKHTFELDEGHEDTSSYHYYSFWKVSGYLWGEIESTTYREDHLWTAAELMGYDQEEFTDEASISQLKSSHREVQTGGRPAFVMTYRYFEDGDKTVNLRMYWQHVRQLHSISLEFPEADEKEGKATFERIWRSLKPPIVATRSPNG